MGKKWIYAISMLFVFSGAKAQKAVEIYGRSNVKNVGYVLATTISDGIMIKDNDHMAIIDSSGNYNLRFLANKPVVAQFMNQFLLLYPNKKYRFDISGRPPFFTLMPIGGLPENNFLLNLRQFNKGLFNSYGYDFSVGSVAALLDSLKRNCKMQVGELKKYRITNPFSLGYINSELEYLFFNNLLSFLHKYRITGQSGVDTLTNALNAIYKWRFRSLELCFNDH